MHRWIVSGFCLGFLFITSTLGQDKKQESDIRHGEGCPAKCKICTNAIEKALDFLARKLDKKGSLRVPRGQNLNDMLGGAGDIMTTALAGLAFIANGSTTGSGKYKEQLARIKEYLLKIATKDIPKRRVNGDTWPAALTALFLAHIYEKEKDEKSELALKSLVKFLTKQQSKDGGWSLGNTQGFMTETQNNLTAAVNLCIISLAKVKSVGIDVEDKVFKRSAKFYEKMLMKDGWFNYKIEDGKNPHPEPRQGRSIAALLALKCLGEDQDKRYEKAYEYARKNIKQVASHHLPHLHMMLGGFSYFYMGKEDWLKFVDVYFKKIIARQKDNGSVKSLIDHNPRFMMTSWYDHNFGDVYATANLALILQIPMQNVNFQSKVKTQ
jgi:hypothetical protein